LKYYQLGAEMMRFVWVHFGWLGVNVGRCICDIGGEGVELG